MVKQYKIDDDSLIDMGKMKKAKVDNPTTPVVVRATTLLDPKVADRQLTWIAPGKCDRLGACCIRIPLDVSPRQLREAYEEWLAFTKHGNRAESIAMSVKEPHPYHQTYRDIYLIYPMLVGKCLGKIPKIKHTEWDEIKGNKYIIAKKTEPIISIANFAGRYVYGPCRNFSFSKAGLAECAIHDHKPELCSSYPNGGAGTFKGCGFNLYAETGLTIADLSKDKLEPLSPEEL